MAYTFNQQGQYKVIIQNRQSGKGKAVLKGGYKLVNQQVEYNLPLISWQNDTTLAIVRYKRGKNYFMLYNILTHKKQEKELAKFNQITDFSFSPQGRYAVLSANVKGQIDLYLLNMRKNTVRRLTNDIYDDIHPKFIPNSRAIVFSSNRRSDTAKVKSEGFDVISDHFNLYIYSLDTATKKRISKLTNTISKDVNPIPDGAGKVYYLSDQKGIFNLYCYNLNTSIFHQVSSYALSIRDYDINFDKADLAFIMIQDGKDYIYYMSSFDLNNEVFPPATKRKEVMDTKQIHIKLQQREKNLSSDDKNPEIKKETYPDEDVGNQIETEAIDTDDYVFDPKKSENEDTTISPRKDQATNLIDTEDYTFEKEVVQKSQQKESYLTNYRRLQKETRIIGPQRYHPEFSTNNVITSFLIDPLTGFSLQLETQMNDLLENHRFYGGLGISIVNLRSGTVFAEYQYIKHLLDYHARYERRSIYPGASNIFILQKYASNKFEVGASYPINVNSRVSVNPFYMNTFSYNLGVGSSPDTDQNFNYGGVSLEYIFDNSLLNGVNLREGTRAKVTLDFYNSFGKPQGSFNKFEFGCSPLPKNPSRTGFCDTPLLWKIFWKEPQKLYIRRYG